MLFAALRAAQVRRGGLRRDLRWRDVRLRWQLVREQTRCILSGVSTSDSAFRFGERWDHPSTDRLAAMDIAGELHCSRSVPEHDSDRATRGETMQEESDKQNICTGAPGRRRHD